MDTSNAEVVAGFELASVAQTRLEALVERAYTANPDKYFANKDYGRYFFKSAQSENIDSADKNLLLEKAMPKLAFAQALKSENKRLKTWLKKMYNQLISLYNENGQSRKAKKLEEKLDQL